MECCEVEGCHRPSVDRVTIRRWTWPETRGLCATHLAQYRLGDASAPRVRIVGAGEHWPVYQSVDRLRRERPDAIVVVDDWVTDGAGQMAAEIAHRVSRDGDPVDAVVAIGSCTESEWVDIRTYPTWWPKRGGPPPEWVAAVRRSS